MRRSMGVLASVAIAASLVGVVALATSPHGFAQETTPAATPIASPVASPGASPVAQSGPGFQVEIEILDGAFQPNALLLRANRDVMLTLVNRGTMVHSFNIDELNIHTGDIQPGQSVTVTINAKPGTYRFDSAVGGQPEPGMTGKFTIS